jgi:phage shock protein C
MEKLYRSKKDRKIAGVCGGIAERFTIDATIIRLAWALVTIFTAFFPGILAYIIAWIIVPERP